MPLKGSSKDKNVLYVQWFKHELLSVGQLYDSHFIVTFFTHHCEIRRNGSKQIIGRGARSPGGVYMLEEIEGERCYIS